MADPAVITAWVMAAGAAVTAVTPLVMARRKAARQRDSTTLASFTALNNALDREIQRLHGDMTKLRDDYERRLDAAQDRITELESEVATLQRLLRQGPAP